MEAVDKIEEQLEGSRETDSWEHPWGLPERVLSPVHYVTGSSHDTDQPEDPKYGARFARLSDEIHKLGNTDYELISRLSVELLEKEGKDLRALGFLCLSELHERGLVGFTASIIAIRGCIAEFADNLFPRREQGRRSAVEWLTSSRMLAFVKRACAYSSLSELENGIAELAGLESDLDSLLAEPPSLRSLHECMTQYLPTAKAHLMDGSPEQDNTSAKEQSLPARVSGFSDYFDNVNCAESAQVYSNTSSSVPISGKAKLGPVNCESDMARYLRGVIDYLRGEGDYLRMVALSRGWKWAGIHFLTVQEENRLAIEAPRKQAIRAIQSNIQEKCWNEVLQACERAFLEPGGHLFLDIQVWAQSAALNLGMDHLAQRIRMEIHDLLARIPELPNLCFVDGQPLLSPQYIEWIKTCNQPELNIDSKTYAVEVDASNKSFVEYITDLRRALSISAEKNGGSVRLDSFNHEDEMIISKQTSMQTNKSSQQAKISIEFSVDLP